jgi:uncharacterized Zn finger protein
MQIPNSLNLECPNCGEFTLHNLKRGKLSTKGKITYDCVVECTVCELVHHEVIVEEKNIELPVIMSTANQSEKHTISLPPDSRLSVGDEIIVDDIQVKITGIELSKRRKNSAQVSEIKTLWCKRFDKLKMHISINSGSRTLSRSFFAVPDEEFYLGEIIKSGRDQIVVHKIKTHKRIIKDGGTTAREITRLYGRFVR